jgi:MFS family permease
MSDESFRAVKAVLKTALTWGLALGAFAGTLIGLYVLVFAGPGVESLPERIGEALFAGVGMGIRFAVAGAILGTLFATMVRLSFRGKRVADLSPGRFALIGAVIGGVGIPLVYQLLNIISGGPIPWSLLIDDIPWAAFVGGAGAYATIWMARRASALPEEEEQGVLGVGDPLGGMHEVGEREGVVRK